MPSVDDFVRSCEVQFHQFLSRLWCKYFNVRRISRTSPKVVPTLGQGLPSYRYYPMIYHFVTILVPKSEGPNLPIKSPRGNLVSLNIMRIPLHPVACVSRGTNINGGLCWRTFQDSQGYSSEIRIYRIVIALWHYLHFFVVGLK